MMKLLRIDCSPRIKNSHSRTIADYFEKTWQKAHPSGTVIYRDLTKTLIPHLQNNTIEGFYTPPDALSPDKKEALSVSDMLVEELKSADEVLISSPLFNYNVPSSLKAYIDQVVRVGHTFGINEKGYFGMLTNITAYIVTAKGGNYKGTLAEKYDFQEPYLEAVLGHMGIGVKQIFSLEGTGLSNFSEQNKEPLYQMIDSHFKQLATI